MEENTPQAQAPDSAAPRRLRDVDIAERYGISRRTAGEWLRRAVALGVLKKLGGVTVGRWSALDAWVEAGGQVPQQRRRGGSR